MAARPFHAIFAGLDDAHGSYQLPRGNPAPGEKWEGRAVVIKSSVTVNLYTQHLQGDGSGLGIIPIMRDNHVWWCAIDVDDYNDKGPEHWDKQVRKLNLPLVVCASKSNGTHLFLFFSRRCPAKVAQDYLKSVCAKLGLPSPPRTEIFPKQTVLNDGGVGNWINLPYFGDTRLCVHQGRRLPLQEFLDLVAARELDPNELDSTLKQDDDDKGDGIVPPCIITIQKEGVPEGGRNNVLTQVAIYMRRRFDDAEWRDKLFDWNQEFCDPPLRPSEVNQIADSVGRKTYNYRCQEPVIAQFCNSTKCARVEFGIGNPGDQAYTDFPITHLTRVMTEPVTWLAEVNGVKVRCTTDQLTNFGSFRKRVLEELKVYLADRSNREWSDTVAELTMSATDEQMPEMVTESGQVSGMFYEWCAANCSVNRKWADILLGGPFYDEPSDSIYFLGSSILNYVHAVIDRRITPEIVWRTIEGRFNGMEKEMPVMDRSVKMWVVPCNGKRWFTPPEIGGDKF